MKKKKKITEAKISKSQHIKDEEKSIWRLDVH